MRASKKALVDFAVTKRRPEQEYELLSWDFLTRGFASSSVSQQGQQHYRARDMATWGSDDQLAFYTNHCVYVIICDSHDTLVNSIIFMLYG